MANTGTDTAAAEARREARRAYKRKWAKEHPENVKQHNERFWAKKAKEMREAAGQEAQA